MPDVLKNSALAQPSSQPSPGEVEGRCRERLCVIDGVRFAAVPERDFATKDGILFGASPVGRIDLDGEPYLLFDRPKAAPATRAAEVLTRRELQVAMLVAQGKCDKQIARQLGISGYTVREHLRRTFAKLNVPRRAALVAVILQQGAERGLADEGALAIGGGG